MTEPVPSDRDREMAHEWAVRWFGDGFDAADELESVDINDLVKVIATARAKGEAKGRSEAIEKCAKIIAAHPDTGHPDFDTELMRGCCELMEAQVRDLSEPASDVDRIERDGILFREGEAKGRREAVEELQAYRDAAQYDAHMSGPIFKSWNRSQLERARKLTERALAEPASGGEK